MQYTEAIVRLISMLLLYCGVCDRT